MKKIVFCGGGTAGHVMPNIAIIERIKDKYEIHYIGGSGIEKNIISKYKYIKYHEIPTTKLVRKFTVKNLKIPFVLLKAISESRKILKEIKPDVIFSKGGYASVPVVLAHGKAPVLGHESDYTMGLANKLIYPKCKKMFFSFRETALKYKKGIYSGTPIRKEILCGNAKQLKEKLGIFNNRKVVLVVGGSSGATAINEFITKNINELTKKYNIIHISGKGKANNVKCANYYPIEYADNMGDYIALSDIVVSRAGSNAIFEFLACEKPMILIPLPTSESRGDQILNARYFENNGWAKVIQQDDLDIKKMMQLLSKSEKPPAVNLPDALKTIIKEIENL